MMKPFISLVVGLFVLVSCGNDTESFAVARAAQAIAKAQLPGAQAPAAPKLRRADLKDILSPIQLISIEQRNQKALVAETAQNGSVSTWSSVDKVTISLRNGVLVATRGLGDDLMAASAQPPSLKPAGGAAYTRLYTILNGSDQPVRVSATCSTVSNGGQTIEVVERIYQVTELVETCQAKTVTFDNQYWIDRSGNIRKSRQWVSPEVGQIVIEDLR